MRTYLAEIKQGGVFHERLSIEAPHRGKAVHKIQLYFWYKYRGRLGTADQAIVVNDPYGEVRYSDSFKCKDKKNLLLPEDVIIRLLQEARGELIRDTRIGTPHYARGSVRRRKRRRDFGRFIAPSIRQMRSGKIYYRINVRPQIVRNGRRYQKRKYQDIPLAAKTLAEAIHEIRSRELHVLNARVQKRKITSRELSRLEIIERMPMAAA